MQGGIPRGDTEAGPAVVAGGPRKDLLERLKQILQRGGHQRRVVRGNDRYREDLSIADALWGFGV